MTLLELAQEHTITSVFVIDSEGDSTILPFDDATREKFGEVQVRRIAQRMWESPWQVHQYPQGSVTFGLVVTVA